MVSLNGTSFEGRQSMMNGSITNAFVKQKRLKPKHKKNETGELCRFEVAIMSKIDHPHVIRLHGATYDDFLANQNIFFEWMAGGSVAQLLQKHGPFTDHVICSYLHQTLLGLDYLHCLGILHRDLKGKDI